jgi:hypothetical protein
MTLIVYLSTVRGLHIGVLRAGVDAEIGMAEFADKVVAAASRPDTIGCPSCELREERREPTSLVRHAEHR